MYLFIDSTASMFNVIVIFNHQATTECDKKFSSDFWSGLCIFTIHLSFVTLHLKATSRSWMYDTLAYSSSYEQADRC